MLTVICRHLLSGEYGPFDRVVELGVFILIAYEVVVGFTRHRKAAKRQREMDGRVSRVYDFVARGQMLQHAVPADGLVIPGTPQAVPTQTAAMQWRTDAQSWIMDTNAFLVACSPQASAKFLDDSRASFFRENNIHRPETQTLLETVNRRLNNLQDIMQNPSAYL
jgi:hypothetical protein